MADLHDNWVSTKPYLVGGIVGAALLALILYSTGLAVTSGTAEKMAATRAKTAVIQALSHACVVQAQADAEGAAQLAEVKDQETSNYRRHGIVTDARWAEMPFPVEGVSVRDIVTACAAALAKSDQQPS